MGGFRVLDYSQRSQYHSSLGINGTIGWSIHNVETVRPTTEATELNLSISFPEVDWKFLQSFYGWAALQYQGWARGEIFIHGSVPRTIVLYTDNVLEFYVDNALYFGGDFYAYQRAPLVLHLTPGPHIIDIRIVRDVRATGGIGNPIVNMTLRVELSRGGLAVMGSKLLLPEMVEGRLVSNLGSVPVRNEEQDWIEVLAIESLEVYDSTRHCQ